MNKNDITSLLNYDKESGLFSWTSGRRGAKSGLSAGSSHKGTGYVYICVNQKKHLAHRLAWLFEHGEMPKNQIDHIDGDRANNAIANLREVTCGENLQNQRKPHSNNRHGFMGCSYDPRDGRWSAYLRKDGKLNYLGRFSSGEEAHQRYIAAKREMHPFATI